MHIKRKQVFSLLNKIVYINADIYRMFADKAVGMINQQWTSHLNQGYLGAA